MNTIFLSDIEPGIDDCSAWVRVNNIFDVQFVKTDEGVVINVFRVEAQQGPFNEAIASTYMFDDPERD